MRGFTAIDLMYMLKELQQLVGGRMDKIYQMDDELYINIYVTNEGKKLLRVKQDKLWLTKNKPEFEELPHFAETLRRHIDNARIREIKQIGSERILEITLQKEETYKLYIELFSTGNIVLEKEDKIIAALHERKWKDREIRRGRPYKLPPEMNDVFAITKEKVKEALKEEKAAKATAKLGLGKDYAFEICTRAGIPLDQINADADRLMKSIKEILTSEINPQVYYEDDKAVDATPMPFISKKQKNISTKTFSAAVDLIEEKPVKKDKTLVETDKTAKIIKLQEKQIKEIKEKAAKEQRKGELIYEKYQELKEILEKIKNKEELPENVTIDWERKKVKIKLEDK